MESLIAIENVGKIFFLFFALSKVILFFAIDEKVSYTWRIFKQIFRINRSFFPCLFRDRNGLIFQTWTNYYIYYLQQISRSNKYKLIPNSFHYTIFHYMYIWIDIYANRVQFSRAHIYIILYSHFIKYILPTSLISIKSFKQLISPNNNIHKSSYIFQL